VAVPSASDERQDPPAAPVSDMKRAEDEATLEASSRKERVVAEGPLDSAPRGRAVRRRHARARRRERLATSQPTIQTHKPEPRERTPESRVARPVPSEVERPEPIDDVALVAEVTPPRARAIDEASHAIPVHAGSRPLLVVGIVAVSVASFAAGFGGGFLFGQRSAPSTESIDVSHHESAADPQPARAAVEDPKSVATSSEPTAATVARQPAVPAVDSGRLLVRSTPAGVDVVVDGQSRGVTPLDLRELAFGAHTIKVSHPGHDTRQRQVTLSERRPVRSVTFTLRPTSVPSDASPAENASGSLLVISRPSQAQVFVDDNLIGTTPFLLSNVEAGERHLRIELSGYKTWTTSVKLEPGARFRVSASLEP